VSFLGAADAYDRFMGRYSVLLAPQLADFARVASGQVLPAQAWAARGIR
jgi:hypothetical protein